MPDKDLIRTIVTGLLDSLKAQPGMIIIVVLNVLVFGMLYFGVSRSNERHDQNFMKVIDSCLNKKG